MSNSWDVEQAIKFLEMEIKLYRTSHEISHLEVSEAKDEIAKNPKLSFAEAVVLMRARKGGKL